MRPTVYVETSVIGYLTISSSRDLVVAAHQQITREWWATAKSKYDLLVSTVVLEEIRRGDADAAARRLAQVEGLPVLGVSPAIRDLASEYQRLLQLPTEVEADLYHIACAAGYEVDYLVTWNCAHIANVNSARRIAQYNLAHGHFMPMIVTPDWFEVES